MSDDAVPVPDPEDVPAELRERDQWLMWDTAEDKPRAPLNEQGYKASWTDPDEAREIADEIETRGIGYVFANTNDEHPRGIYGALDLDGCTDEDGHPKEWLPSLAPFADRDAYIEWSPSGTGLHIPLAGFEPPEWWSDQHFTDDEHEGVEAYGSKFFTVTGDQLDGAGDTAADTGEWVDAWLREAYKSITGEDPLDDEQGDASAGGGGSGGEYQWSGEEIRDALDHINPDVSYPLWRDIGFALADHFDDATALSIYKNWSRDGQQWDHDAEQQAERIIDDATPGGGRTIGTVIHHAGESGWESSTPRTASADGGVTAAPTTSDDGPTPDIDGGIAWASIRALFKSSENGTTGEAKQAAAKLLLQKYEFLTIKEESDTDNIWRYKPDTGIYVNDGRTFIRKKLADGLDHTYSRTRVTDILHRIRSETYVDRDSLGAPEDMICLSDCVLDLSDPENPTPLPHSPKHRFTWALNAPYDPDAKAPHFRRFLGESVRPEDIPKLQEYAGDALRHWKQPRNLCVLLGPTDSGKGVFLRMLRSVFGEENVASETLSDLTDTRWGAYSLLRRPINLANELSTGQLECPERAKNFSGGGDTISVEDKGESKFEAMPTANHIFATNQVPQVANADAAFYNRWLFVTFPESVPTEEQDDKLDERIVASDEERAGILNWLIEGYARRQERDGTGFDAERSITEKEDMWSAYGTSIDRFVATCLDADEATDADAIPKRDVYAVYKTMCNAVGVSVESQQKLTAEIKKLEGVGDSKRKTDSYFDERERVPVYTGLQYDDKGEAYLKRARDAREAAEEMADTDDAQTDLDQAEKRHRAETATEEIAQEQAIRTLLETVEDMTDEGRGDPVAIEDVIDEIPHWDERGRALIRQLIERTGQLIEGPEDHILPA